MSMHLKKQQDWKQVGQLEIETNRAYRVHLQDVPFEVTLVKEIFNNSDGSVGVRFLISSNTDQTADDVIITYKKNGSVKKYIVL